MHVYLHDRSQTRRYTINQCRECVQIVHSQNCKSRVYNERQNGYQSPSASLSALALISYKPVLRGAALCNIVQVLGPYVMTTQQVKQNIPFMTNIQRRGPLGKVGGDKTYLDLKKHGYPVLTTTFSSLNSIETLLTYLSPSKYRHLTLV